MIAVNLNIKEGVYDKVMYLLKSLPKEDVKIVGERNIEEIDPTKLPKDDFDFMSKDYLKHIDKSIDEAKKIGFENMQSYQEFRDDL